MSRSQKISDTIVKIDNVITNDLLDYNGEIHYIDDLNVKATLYYQQAIQQLECAKISLQIAIEEEKNNN